MKYDKLYEIPTSDYRPPYTYKADAASEVSDIVPVYCGVGKIDGPTFIQTVDGNKEVMATEYYDFSGLKLSAPTKGINIVRSIYNDGSVKTAKMVIK